ncbi:MAG: substrate-binding domain-containing protein [Burkholderiales bacterium]|nr:substrate-binding domain-containing protein [Burkholderiales bacterium]
MSTPTRSLSLCLAALLVCAPPAQAADDIRLATTTSTENSGLLAQILPKFEAKYGAKVRVVAVGTGAALKLGENCDADVLLVHARPLEDKFMAAGYGSVRKDVMYNDFVIVGPKSDPAGVRGGKDVTAAMKKIAASGAKFVSRGDESGTHQMEKAYWKDAGAQPQGAAYVSAGQGMGQVLTMAGELQGYTLSDRATFAAYRDKTGLEILVEGDPRMFNPYGVIAVNPQKCPGVNHKGAMALVDWMVSPEGQQAIAAFKVNGQQMFFPDAKQALKPAA